MLSERERFLLKALTRPSGRNALEIPEPENFYKLAKEYNLLAFLYHRLSEEALSGFSKEMTKELREFYMISLKRSLRQRKETLAVIDTLNKGGVAVILLKGPLLGERIYRKEGIRSGLIDIDLLIRYGDLPLTERLFAGIGYRVNHYRYGWLERSMAQVNCVSSSRKREGEKALIELHWRPFHNYEWDDIIPTSEYWRNAFNKNIEGVEVKFLSNELLFIYLCLLLGKETRSSSRIRYLLDLYYFLLRYKDSLDYAALTKMISGYGLGPYISFSLDSLEEATGPDRRIREELLGRVKAGPLKRAYFKLVMDRKGKITPEGSSKQKQIMVNIFLFSRGSLWGLAGKFYLTAKASYLRSLENSSSRPSLNTLVGHFLKMSKSL